MKTIDEYIKTDDKAICENIDDLEYKTRDKVAQNILSYFRNIVEHIAVRVYSEEHENAFVDYDTIPKAVEFLKTSNEFYFLRKFHQLLQESRSHYTPDNDGAERLLLKYYEYLLQIKDFVYRRYQMQILSNIDKFPIDLDDTLQQYYEKIVEKLDKVHYQRAHETYSERFYVQKSKPFFVNHHVYYENTLIPTNDESSKFNKLVVFSAFKIPANYAIKVDLDDDIIEISGKFMPIKIVTAWSVSIRPCELKNFAKIFGYNIEVRSDLSEYIGLMNYISRTGLNLVEILEFSDRRYQAFKERITEKAQKIVLCDIFDRTRDWIRTNRLGSHSVRSLLYGLNNKIIKAQLSKKENYRMKGLYLDIKVLPFEEMPFNSSLCNHNPSIYDLLSCIKSEGREHELLARRININADTYAKLYTKTDELAKFENIDELVKIYNDSLYRKHQNRRLEIMGKNLFVKGYEDDTKEIIQNLISLTEEGVVDYNASVEDWLIENPNVIDSDEKRAILLRMFENSSLAMIYGAAGTGKSTLIKHISQFWNDGSKVYIANTHPAVENLRRRVKDNSGEYLTIKKFIYSYPADKTVDILFIDECSMVSNRDMIEVLRKKNFKLLVLVGDIYQIESIQFGNWFNLARYFVPVKTQYELTELYRTENKQLQELWSRVRNYQDNITEWMGHCGYTTKLDESIFERTSESEIVLCLNYDGLYGINNINRFLQSDNPNKAFVLGVWTYKIGDPILFSDSSKYDPILYNNLGGKIVNIEEEENRVLFSIEIDKVLNSIHVSGTELELMPKLNPGKSVVRLAVKKKNAGDDDNDDEDAETNVPFQIAYAVSIHKAQGLEYNSVKIVITKEVDEMITHNIFYTAITRARENLKVYWTPESQKKILDSFINDETSYDAKIFSARTGLKIIKRRVV